MGLLSVPEDEVNAAIQALNDLAREPDDPAARAVCIQKITPTLRKLAAGRELEKQIHKLIDAGNPERAAKLLAAVPRRKKLFG